VRNYITKTVTLPDDHWQVLEREAFLALMPVDKLLAHAVRLMQRDAIHARSGLTVAYVDQDGRLACRDAPVGLPAFD